MSKRILLVWIFTAIHMTLFAGADTLSIKAHLHQLTQVIGYRHYNNMPALNQAAEYVYTEMAKYADSIYYQTFTVEGKTYKNIIAVWGLQHKKRMIVGAHYDVCGPQAGADDNASGVVGLLELTRLLKGKSLTQRVELVAYTLEEPPYFRTEYMGSYVHAQSLVAQNIPVTGMVCLEMIGYFSDEKHSQDYPIPLLSWVYGNKGNYITLVRKFGAGKFVREFTHTFRAHRSVRTKQFAGPPALPGIDFSDHLNYWAVGIPALMITDTAFYRNKNYHQSTDTMQTLNLEMMAKVIDSVYATIVNM